MTLILKSYRKLTGQLSQKYYKIPICAYYFQIYSYLGMCCHLHFRHFFLCQLLRNTKESNWFLCCQCVYTRYICSSIRWIGRENDTDQLGNGRRENQAAATESNWEIEMLLPIGMQWPLLEMLSFTVSRGGQFSCLF